MSPRRVIIVEDSSTMRILLESIIESDSRLELVASYSTAERAIANIEKDLPDVISMDIMLPGIDGHEATRELIQKRPTPIVIISSTIADEMNGTMSALKHGALSALAKPSGPSSGAFTRDSRLICDTLFNMSQVKVIRQFARRTSSAKRPAASSQQPISGTPSIFNQPLKKRPKVIVIGSSTGGPATLEKFFNALNPQAHPPILLVQHISPGFTQGLAEWLESTTPHTFKVAEHAEALRAGMVYIAPDDHLILEQGRILLSKEPTNIVHKPSVDVLFNSVAETYQQDAVGMIFTGMGRDGADGLLKLKENGAWTVAQDELSCVVYGMPRAAVEIGAACAQMNVIDIAEQINQAVL